MWDAKLALLFCEFIWYFTADGDIRSIPIIPVREIVSDVVLAYLSVPPNRLYIPRIPFGRTVQNLVLACRSPRANGLRFCGTEPGIRIVIHPEFWILPTSSSVRKTACLSAPHIVLNLSCLPFRRNVQNLALACRSAWSNRQFVILYLSLWNTAPDVDDGDKAANGLRRSCQLFEIIPPIGEPTRPWAGVPKTSHVLAYRHNF